MVGEYADLRMKDPVNECANEGVLIERTINLPPY